MNTTIFTTHKAPVSNSHIPQTGCCKGFGWLPGQIPQAPRTGECVRGSTGGQTRRLSTSSRTMEPLCRMDGAGGGLFPGGNFPGRQTAALEV